MLSSNADGVPKLGQPVMVEMIFCYSTLFKVQSLNLLSGRAESKPNVET